MHIKDKLNTYQQILNHQNHFTHLFDCVDSEDIANEKIRTNDLALEINKMSIDNDNNDKELEHDHIMFTQPGDPNNKSKSAYKNIVIIVIKTITVFQIVTKNNVMKNTKNIEIRDQELPNNRSYNTSVVNPAILKITELKIKLIIFPEIMIIVDIAKIFTIMIDIGIMIDTEVTAEIIHKTIIDLILDKDTTIDLNVHIHPDLDMTTTIKEELHPDLHIDDHTETPLIIDIILDQDIDLVLNHKEIPLDDIIIHIDLHPNQEVTDHDLEHLHRIDNKIESIK